MTTNNPRPRPSRAARIGFVICLALLTPLGTVLGVVAYRPFAKADVLRSHNDAEEKQYLALRLQNQRIEREIRSLNTRDGVINAARPLGWVLPGEHRLRPPQP